VRIGTSLVLIAVGLVLAYAIDFELPGIELSTLGSILFFIGLLGLVVSVGLEVMDHRARHPRPARPARPQRSEPPRREAPAPPQERWDPVVPPREARRAPIDPAQEKTRRQR